MTKTGVDTNVLVRLLVQDDPKQTEQAMAFFSARSPSHPAYVNWIVLLELIWTLRSHYGYATGDLLSVVGALNERTDIVVERGELVTVALAAARDGADFADALIAFANEAAGCKKTVTFDKRASRRLTDMAPLA